MKKIIVFIFCSFFFFVPLMVNADAGENPIRIAPTIYYKIGEYSFIELYFIGSNEIQYTNIKTIRFDYELDEGAGWEYGGYEELTNLTELFFLEKSAHKYKSFDVEELIGINFFNITNVVKNVVGSAYPVAILNFEFVTYSGYTYIIDYDVFNFSFQPSYVPVGFLDDTLTRLTRDYTTVVNDAYMRGKFDGQLESNDELGFGGLLSASFIALSSLLAIELLPNISLGMIIAIPIVFGVIAFILGRRKE